MKSKNAVSARIAVLRKEIEHHRYLYHVLDRQEISDAALDSLKKELFDLETEHPELITADSPTQRVAGEPLPGFTKFTHQKRMLSLNDAFSRADMDEWSERIRKLIPRDTYTLFAEPKIDGLALSLWYEDGLLQVAATRGNGFVGEDVTQNIRTVQSVPLRLHDIPAIHRAKRIEVRGEVYMTKTAFDQVNREREAAGEPTFMNPRNLAAGSIRQLDPKLTAARDLRFLAYSLPTDLGQQTHAQEHELLKKMGFYTDPDSRVCADIDAVMDLYNGIHEKRERMNHQIDGVVVVINENSVFERLGIVGKAPRGAMALKFPAEQTTTIVEDIQLQVGRTGVLTPVAHLRPVPVAGTRVARATLHNMDEIERLDVRIGDTVIIEKAGDIIPDIVEVLVNLRPKNARKFVMPKVCPVCNSAVVHAEDEAGYYCSNTECEGKSREQLYHFVSKVAMDIDGLGPKIIDQLVEQDLIRTPADLYLLRPEDLMVLEGFKEKSTHNLIDAIKASSRVTLKRFIFALGIRHVGELMAASLAEHFLTIKKLMNASTEELDSIENIGPAVIESLKAYFENPKHRALVEQLLEHITIARQAPAITGPLSGKTFVFTGTLEHMTRTLAKERVEKLGGKALSSIVKDLDYLVVGADSGSKLKKAQEYGVTILSEAEFLKMV